MQKPPQENIKNLHKYLAENVNGFTRSYEDFAQDLQDEGKRTKVHEHLSRKVNGFNRSFEAFSEDMGVAMPDPKKKIPGEDQLPVDQERLAALEVGSEDFGAGSQNPSKIPSPLATPELPEQQQQLGVPNPVNEESIIEGVAGRVSKGLKEDSRFTGIVQRQQSDLNAWQQQRLKELQEYVKENKIGEDEIYKVRDQFTRETSKKLEELQEKYKPEVDQLSSLYQQAGEYELQNEIQQFYTSRNNFSESQIEQVNNPLQSFGAVVADFFGNTIPSTSAGLVAALTPDDTYMGPVGYAVTPKQRKEQKQNTVAARQAAINYAIEQQGESQVRRQGLTDTVEEINDPLDFINFTFVAAGEAITQIPLALATGGASSVMQGIGSVYVDGVRQMAEEKDITPEEVIAQGEDSKLTAVLFGTVSGMLDRIGAGAVAGSIGKKAFATSLQKRAMSALKNLPKGLSASAKVSMAMGGEAITETIQTGLEEFGAGVAGGKDFIEAIQSVDANTLIDAAALGALGAGALTVGGRGARSAKERFINTDRANKQLSDELNNSKNEQKKDSQATQPEVKADQPTAEPSPVESDQAEAGVPDSQESITASESPTLKDTVGRRVSVDGKVGTLKDEGNGKFVLETKDEIIELANDPAATLSDVSAQMISQERIAVWTSNNTETTGDMVSLDGENYNYVSTNTNDKGEVVSTTLQREDGKQITVRDKDLALEIDIERNKIPTRQQVESQGQQAVNDQVINEIVNDQEVDVDEPFMREVDVVLDMNMTDRIDQALEKDPADINDQERLQVRMWAEDAIQRLESLPQNDYNQRVTESLYEILDTVNETATETKTRRQASPQNQAPAIGTEQREAEPGTQEDQQQQEPKVVEDAQETTQTPAAKETPAPEGEGNQVPVSDRDGNTQTDRESVTEDKKNRLVDEKTEPPAPSNPQDYEKGAVVQDQRTGDYYEVQDASDNKVTKVKDLQTGETVELKATRNKNFTPADKKKAMTEVANSQKQRINDALDLAAAFNEMTKAKRDGRKGQQLKQSAKLAVTSLGYKVETGSTNTLKVIDPETGKEARKKRIAEDTSDFLTKNDLSEDELITLELLEEGDVLDIIGENENRLNIDMLPRDFKKGVKDMRAGKSSWQSDRVVQFVQEVHEAQAVPFATQLVPILDLQDRAGAEVDQALEDQQNDLGYDDIDAPFQEGRIFADQSERSSKGDRVPPARLPEGVKHKVKKLRDIVLDLSKNIGRRIAYSKSPSKRSALGSYNPRSAAVVIRAVNDIDTIAHEIGHALDDKYKLLQNLFSNPDTMADFYNELKAFSVFGSKPPKGHPDPRKYEMGEGVAEWFRAFIVNPDDARKKAPRFTEHYEATVPANVRKKIEGFSNDVRAYATASGFEQIMSNVEMPYDKQKDSWLSWLKPSTLQSGTFEIDLWDNLAVRWTNALRPFEKSIEFLKYEQGIDDIPPEKDPQKLVRNLLGAKDGFSNILKNGMVDARNKRIKDKVSGEKIDLKFLFKPLDNLNSETIRRELAETVSYMIAQRTNELSDRLVKDIVSGIGGGIYKDTYTANKYLKEVENMSPEKQARIKEAARRYRVFADSILQYMVDKGRLSKDQYQKIKDKNAYYVSFQRVMEAAPGEEIIVVGSGGKISSVVEPIKKVKGSSRSIKNPYQSLLDTAFKGIQEADRNEAMRSFRDLMENSRKMYSDNPDVQNLANIGTKVDKSAKNTITVFVEGKAEYWQLVDDIYKSLKGVFEVAKSVPKLLALPANIVRTTVTTFTAFATRNKLRDIQSHLILSRSNPFSGLDIYKPGSGIMKESKDGFELFGGGQAGYYLMNEDFYNRQMDIALAELAKDSKTIIANPSLWGKKGVDAYKELLAFSENSTRIQEYRSAFKKAKKQGMDDYNASIYAAFQARDLMDFAVAGTYMKWVNQVIPFSNAAVQGLKRSIIAAQENPMQFAFRMIIYSIIPATLNRALVGMMDREEEYELLPSYQRDLFYNIPLGPEMWLTIPKPFELGVIGSAADRVLGYALGNENALDGYAGSLAQTILPFDKASITGPFRSVIENITNYDFFRQKHIIPPSEEGLDLRLRNTDRASRLGQALQKVFGVDARKIDHTIIGTTTYYGKVALALSDLGRIDSRHDPNWLSMGTGILKDFPVYASQDVQWLMGKAKDYDLDRDPYYKALNEVMRYYYESPDEKEKKKRQELVLDVAKRVRKLWSNVDFDKYVEEQLKNKKK